MFWDGRNINKFLDIVQGILLGRKSRDPIRHLGTLTPCSGHCGWLSGVGCSSIHPSSLLALTCSFSVGRCRLLPSALSCFGSPNFRPATLRSCWSIDSTPIWAGTASRGLQSRCGYRGLRLAWLWVCWDKARSILGLSVILEEGEGFFEVEGRLIDFGFYRFLQSFESLWYIPGVLRNIFRSQGGSYRGAARTH